MEETKGVLRFQMDEDCDVDEEWVARAMRAGVGEATKRITEEHLRLAPPGTDQSVLQSNIMVSAVYHYLDHCECKRRTCASADTREACVLGDS